ncbi:GNAT family N-acetyltransferase [Candidatus Lucifugimonas marina]|jgi:ribosomal protein S18 acetylase RimI-like enzyme|uniref:GNAT family N-acetyltransferase n=1 Tax=Candidatus Lucifugimonas marina TaxID=3038979 RepID=A0AAJ5ZC62_9CHLR|nr:GNAT family N-acetyltransferase [SAR202 cluster bacterium JH702]MDG0869906.1 GNAT family N-acetyltransferase [SAR202 cluster bacterium JH639]WFG34631.1 GNAT family N-acetyltransferase [SAR202 cluster bacterium JH545]WFG38559.1 GNAT family N-acetyltransferase [SAR202 cluster bacterium JH1073]
MPEEPLEIRIATIDDYESIAQLIHSSHTISFAPFVSEIWVESRSLNQYREKWNGILSDTTGHATTFVAVTPEGNIVGTVGVTKLDSEEFDSQLVGMHVNPASTGQGIGSVLMSHAIEHIRSQRYSKTQLGVIAANTGARRFYEKHGWQIHLELPDGVEGVPIAIYSFTP